MIAAGSVGGYNGWMLEIFVFVILVGMFFVDHRLSSLVKLNREIVESQQRMIGVLREVTENLPWSATAAPTESHEGD